MRFPFGRSFTISSIHFFESVFTGVVSDSLRRESILDKLGLIFVTITKLNGGDRMGRLGRPPINNDPMTNAERQTKHRVKVRKSRKDAVRAMKAAPLYLKWLVFWHEFGERFRLLAQEVVLQPGNSVVILRTPHHVLIRRAEGN
jgi:hypothetical protein